jgi:REP element-mobilizing transposase RayT
MKQRQLSLLPAISKEHGHQLRKGKRKIARPIVTKRPMHMVLRASKARGAWSMLKGHNKGKIYALVLDCAEKHGLKIYDYENVGNHIHLLVRARTRKGLQNFLRVITQKIMFQVTGARKGSPQGKFWDALAYSRVVEWGRELQRLRHYLWKNTVEVLGFDRSQLHAWLDIDQLTISLAAKPH